MFTSLQRQINLSYHIIQQEREEREEIEKELRAQNEAFMAAAAAAAAGGSPPLSHLAGLNIPGLISATDNNGNSGSTTNKEPPPLGLAGLGPIL